MKLVEETTLMDAFRIVAKNMNRLWYKPDATPSNVWSGVISELYPDLPDDERHLLAQSLGFQED